MKRFYSLYGVPSPFTSLDVLCPVQWSPAYGLLAYGQVEGGGQAYYHRDSCQSPEWLPGEGPWNPVEVVWNDEARKEKNAKAWTEERARTRAMREAREEKGLGSLYSSDADERDDTW